MKIHHVILAMASAITALGSQDLVLNYTTSEAGNPFVQGYYADPSIVNYGGLYWVYSTLSLSLQFNFDAFSSPDLINWCVSRPGPRRNKTNFQN
jgi:beta-xylosidase